MRSRMFASALALGVCASACGDPDLATDLNSEGPPEVTMVTVAVEGPGVIVAGAPTGEQATFCLSGEEHRVNRDFCPVLEGMPGVREAQPVTNAPPSGWFARIVFSELLDPSVEELVEGVGTIENTQPVTLTCEGTEIAYGGYYDPSGNDVSFPPGPALVIEPTEFVATGSECEVAVKESVTDKSGNPVADSLRGPYSFAVAPLSIVETLPADGAGADEGIEPPPALLVMFNAPIAPDSLAGTITLETAGDPVPVDLAVSEDDPSVVTVTPQSLLLDNTTYTLTIDAGITDVAGGAFAPAEPVTVTFTTGIVPVPDAGMEPDAGDADGGAGDAGLLDDAGLPV